MNRDAVIAFDRALAVRSVVTTTALRCGLTPNTTREVVKYALGLLAAGHSAARAIRLGQHYARVRAGEKVWP